MTEIERVAKTIRDVIHLAYAQGMSPDDSRLLEPIAKWHLREVRRARGRTVGYVALAGDKWKPRGLTLSSGLVPTRMLVEVLAGPTARVVLIAPRGRRKK